MRGYIYVCVYVDIRKIIEIATYTYTAWSTVPRATQLLARLEALPFRCDLARAQGCEV